MCPKHNQKTETKLLIAKRLKLPKNANNHNKVIYLMVTKIRSSNVYNVNII